VEGYGTEAAPQLAEKTQKWCAKTLVITLVSLMLCNLLQIIFCSVIRDVSIVAELPIFSVLFTLAVLLLSRIIRENTRLKQENDLFI
ncbi:MAG: hypothetical protein IKK29_04430, partial [Christensenellaceae bacterium]|nr:hypothetical protein [Christensenellaceae bacterium]